MKCRVMSLTQNITKFSIKGSKFIIDRQIYVKTIKMPMKNLLNRTKKSEYKERDTPDAEERAVLDIKPVTSSTMSTSTEESQDSIHQLRPMFSSPLAKAEDETKSNSQKFNFMHDTNLNLNPSILNTNLAPSVMTKDSEYMVNSMYSDSKKTYSTKQSSYLTQNSQKKTGASSAARNLEYGQPLQILNIAEESSENPDIKGTVVDKLHELYEDVLFIMNQYNNSSINLSTTVINTIDCFKKFVSFAESFGSDSESWDITTFNNGDMRRIMKIYLHFYDNLLASDVYIKLKLLLVKNFNDFATTLNSRDKPANNPMQNMVKPQNYAIGIDPDKSLPNEDLIEKIMKKIASTSISVKEQNGSFIAPIARGISNDLNILCLYFGYPNPTDLHSKLIQSLHGLYDDIHVVIMKNQIELASIMAESASIPFSNYNASESVLPSTQVENVVRKFKLPFRNPTDSSRPPISLSLSVENASRLSGTMGGYIYPQIDLEKQPHLESYTNSKFAISCGHVCLDNNDEDVNYPHVSAPLAVLISLYKKALWTQYQKFSQQGNDVSTMEERIAYGSVLKNLDKMFPLKKVKVPYSSKREGHEIRNLPEHRFGQIIWGERTLINLKGSDKASQDVENKLSDLAIIKVNKNLKCDQNFLGDDIAFNEYDPALMFDNLYVRKVINLERESKELNINEVDSVASANSNYNGLPIFKYGSTTKFTRGNLNGIKLVYWLDGAIHSSEFVINSVESNTAFAAGGDSGSWILTKLEDCTSESNSKGLGVLGMLHSYDGEHKQFGLFTPMCEILERLETVTNIKWGVVGVPQKDERISGHEVYSGLSATDSDSDNSDSVDDTEYESGAEELEGACPPEID